MFILVAGPSGAGKDTVLALARQALAADHRFRFVRRVITRAADPDGENHEPVSAEEFDRRPFALQWEAHGLRYGIPADIDADLLRGVTVIANVSRGVIARAAARFPVRVIEITAPPEVLRQRLVARGRETSGDVAARLARVVPTVPGVDITVIVNDRTPEEAAARFVAALTQPA